MHKLRGTRVPRSPLGGGHRTAHKIEASGCFPLFLPTPHDKGRAQKEAGPRKGSWESPGMKGPLGGSDPPRWVVPSVWTTGTS